MADEAQVNENAPQGQNVQVRVDERDLNTSYANAFRANGTAEEVVLDFGLNMQSQAQGDQANVIFKVNDRIIMNYYSVKRLAITLGQIVRRHEEAYGELELDVEKRRQS
jgi:hypothetical protein